MMLKWKWLAAGFVLAAGAVLIPGADASKQTDSAAPTERVMARRDLDGMFRSHAESRRGLECLALNVYWEARSEPLEGQLAVAAVTLNRVADPGFPAATCAVVRQGGEARRHRCQFSWWCDGKRDEPREAGAWRQASEVARLAHAGVVSDPTRGALWYHADYVKPAWAAKKRKVAKIGRHIFYDYP